MSEPMNWYSIDYYIELNYEKNPEFHLAHGNQYPGIIPRIGETVWFHSDQANAKRIKKEGLTTAYIVTDICHQITQHPRVNDPSSTHLDFTSTSILVYCVPVEDYLEYKKP